MTKVTAIVSPSARPSPSMMPPMTPTLRVGQHDVPDDLPGRRSRVPYADSFSTGGTISNTSRITDAMNGMIMTDRMMPAVRMPMPLGAPWNSWPITGQVAERRVSSGCT